jgi:hypothetical protein
VTTDVFITNIEDLENRLLSLNIEDRPLFTKYRALRLDLSGESDSNALEVKKEGKGIIS